MNSNAAAQISRWLLPIAVGYLVVWALWWGYRSTVGGGLETSGESVTMVLSGISGVLVLLTAWRMRAARVD
jgi:hypothetical protein